MGTRGRTVRQLNLPKIRMSWGRYVCSSLEG
jgi:hypothetical protein